MPAKLQLAKKALLSLIIFVFLLAFQIAPITAQVPTPLEKAQSDYNFQYTKYKDSQEAYTTARQSYLSFNTAIAKTDAYTKTKNYLVQTDELYLAFIALAKEYANSLNWDKTSLKRDDFNKLMQTEIDYLKAHQQKASDAKTLEELPPLAKELKEQMRDTGQPTFNMGLAMLAAAQNESLLSDFNSLTRILDRVVIFKLRAGETQAILANWASEISDIRTKTETDTNEAKARMDTFKNAPISSGQLNQILSYTQDGQTNLLRAKPLFEELLRIL